MKNKNKNKNEINDYIRLFFTVFLAVFLVFFIYFAGVYIFLVTNTDYDNGVDAGVLPSEYFSDCSVKYKRCIDPDCGLYTFCNDRDYEDCEVYDCGDYYGVATKLQNQQYVFKRESKPDASKIIEKKKACEGTIDILESSCENNNTIVRAKLSVGEACPLNRFVLKFSEDGTKSSTFILEDDVYTISSNFCGDLEEVVAVGSGGIVIANEKL